MSKTVTVQARLEPALKKEADAILATLGLNASAAITLFYKQIVLQRGIPLQLKIPNAETAEAIRELKDAEFRKRAKKYMSAKELLADLDS